MSPLRGRRRGMDAAPEPVDLLFQIGSLEIDPAHDPRVVQVPDEAPRLVEPAPVADVRADAPESLPLSATAGDHAEVEAGHDVVVDLPVVDLPGADALPVEIAAVDLPAADMGDDASLNAAAPVQPVGPGTDEQDDPAWFDGVDAPDAAEMGDPAPIAAPIDMDVVAVAPDPRVGTLERELDQVRAELLVEREAIDEIRAGLAALQPRDEAPWAAGDDLTAVRRDQAMTLLLQRIDALEFARDAVELRLGVLAAATEDADGDDVISRLESRLRELDGQADELQDQRAAVEEMVREFESHRARWNDDAQAVSRARENSESAVIAAKVHVETAEAYVRGIESELAESRDLTGQVRDLREAVARDHLLITTERTEAKAHVELIHDHCDRAAQAETRAREAAEEAQRAGAQSREHAAEGLQLAERARARIDDVRDLHERLAESFSQHQSEQAVMREDLRREMSEARESIERVNAEAVELRELTEQARAGQMEAEASRDRITAADEHVAREVARLDEILAAAAARAHAAEQGEQKMIDAAQQLETIRRESEMIFGEAERARKDAAEVAHLRGEAERVRSLIERATEQMEDTSRQAERQREQIDSLSAASGTRLAQLDEEITRLRGDAGRAHGLLAAATAVRDTLDQEIAAIRVEREQLQTERQDLRDLATGVRADSEIWSERLRRASDQVEGLESELRLAREQINSLVAEQRADAAMMREQRLRASEELALIVAERERAERQVTGQAAAPTTPAPEPAPMMGPDGAQMIRDLKPVIADVVARHASDPAAAERLATLRAAALALAGAAPDAVPQARADLDRALAALGVTA